MALETMKYHSASLTLNGVLRRAIMLIFADRIDSEPAMHAMDDLQNYIRGAGVEFPDGDDVLDDIECELLEPDAETETAAMNRIRLWLDENIPDDSDTAGALRAHE